MNTISTALPKAAQRTWYDVLTTSATKTPVNPDSIAVLPIHANPTEPRMSAKRFLASCRSWVIVERILFQKLLKVFQSEIVRQPSDDPTQSEGPFREWLTRQSLFMTPLNALSLPFRAVPDNFDVTSDVVLEGDSATAEPPMNERLLRLEDHAVKSVARCIKVLTDGGESVHVITVCDHPFYDGHVCLGFRSAVNAPTHDKTDGLLAGLGKYVVLPKAQLSSLRKRGSAFLAKYMLTELAARPSLWVLHHLRERWYQTKAVRPITLKQRQSDALELRQHVDLLIWCMWNWRETIDWPHWRQPMLPPPFEHLFEHEIRADVQLFVSASDPHTNPRRFWSPFASAETPFGGEVKSPLRDDYRKGIAVRPGECFIMDVRVPRADVCVKTLATLCIQQLRNWPGLVLWFVWPCHTDALRDAKRQFIQRLDEITVQGFRTVQQRATADWTLILVAHEHVRVRDVAAGGTRWRERVWYCHAPDGDAAYGTSSSISASDATRELLELMAVSVNSTAVEIRHGDVMSGGRRSVVKAELHDGTHETHASNAVVVVVKNEFDAQEEEEKSSPQRRRKRSTDTKKPAVRKKRPRKGAAEDVTENEAHDTAQHESRPTPRSSSVSVRPSRSKPPVAFPSVYYYSENEVPPRIAQDRSKGAAAAAAQDRRKTKTPRALSRTQQQQQDPKSNETEGPNVPSELPSIASILNIPDGFRVDECDDIPEDSVDDEVPATATRAASLNAVPPTQRASAKKTHGKTSAKPTSPSVPPIPLSRTPSNTRPAPGITCHSPDSLGPDHVLFADRETGQPLVRYWPNAFAPDVALRFSDELRAMPHWEVIDVPLGRGAITTRRQTMVHTSTGENFRSAHHRCAHLFDGTIKRLIDSTCDAIGVTDGKSAINLAWSSWFRPVSEGEADYLREKPEKIDTSQGSIYVVSFGHPRVMIFKPPKPKKQRGQNAAAAVVSEGGKRGRGTGRKSGPRATLMALPVASGSILEFCELSKQCILRQIKPLTSDPPNPDPFGDLFQVRLATVSIV